MSYLEKYKKAVQGADAEYQTEATSVINEADAEIARIETENAHLHEQTDTLMKRVEELEGVIDNCASLILDSVAQEGDLLKNVNKVLAILIEAQNPEEA